MTRQPIIFITGNMGKVKWTQKYIDHPMIHKNLELTEIQALDMEVVVKHKVLQAYELLQQPVLVEDTSVTFEALGKLPGTFIKWFLDELGNDGLCMLVKDKNNQAICTTNYAYYDGKTLKIYANSITGTISDSPRGTNGFGWNPIFIPDGQNKTFAEMTDEQVDIYTPRKAAIKKLNKFLQNHEY